jgi:A/G-specific adenine glycosylase
MLQQTRVETVLPYFERFLARFPDLRELARAPLDEVLRLWSGLGYYARARNLRAAAGRIVHFHAGRFPRSAAALEALPGLGRSSAAAIAVFAFGARRAILDGNARRVLARCFGVSGFPGDPAVTRALWSLAEAELPEKSIRSYTQGLMDLGATVCLRAKPRCDACPLASRCVALREQRVNEIPAPRPRRQLPQREVRWLLLVQRGRVLLERRPANGLWGGLWVFPQLEGRDARSAGRSLGCEVGSAHELPAIEHGFTHFQLRAWPLLCDVRRTVSAVRRPDRRWVDIRQAERGAVPVPVRTLLRGLIPILPTRASGRGALRAKLPDAGGRRPFRAAAA